MNWNLAKRRSATFFDKMGINALGHKLQTTLFSPFVRVVNYHEIEDQHKKNFERHLIYYSEKFINVNENELTEFLQSGKWQYDKPGLILSFDDGLRSHFEIAAPMLDKFGFTGWFFVPTARIRNEKVSDPGSGNRSELNTLDKDQIKYLDQRHVVGSHTQTHCRLSKEVPDETLQFEIVGSKCALEAILGHEVRTFCWVGGEEFTYSLKAAQIVRSVYDLGFMTNNSIVRQNTDPLQLQRTNIEAENPISLVRFQLSGIMDILYFPKRRRVNRITR